MATTTTNREKQNKKGLISFYKYLGNGNSGNYRPKPEPDAVANKSRSRGWLTRKKMNPTEDIKHMFSDGARVSNEEGRNEVKGGIEKEVIVQARKSVSHVEANLGSAVAFLQVKVLVSDMPGSMQVHAFRCARRTYDSLEKFSAKHMAYNMKKEFDKVYGPAWHCIVGSNFGSYVTHATGGFLYFSMEKLYILLFKTKVQRALE